jgi:serine/threonine-protein kinase RsbW
MNLKTRGKLSVNAAFFKAAWPSTKTSVRESIAATLRAIESHGWITTKESRFAFRLCLEEAIVNAIEHGNRCNPEGVFEIAAHDTPDAGGVIFVCDQGCGFDPGAVTLPADTCAGGRGVCLMKYYMDHVAYNCDSHCLEMRFTPQSPVMGGGCNA